MTGKVIPFLREYRLCNYRYYDCRLCDYRLGVERVTRFFLVVTLVIIMAFLMCGQAYATGAEICADSEALAVTTAVGAAEAASAVKEAAESESLAAAWKLHSLGLYYGVGTMPDGTPDFALQRTSSRIEALCMFIRLIGKEAEALGGTWTMPFSDVPDWAKPYAGYAYTNRLINGVSEDKFGSGMSITAAEYLTFILRALGYTPGTDFIWSEAAAFSDSLKITDGRYKDPAVLLRGDIAVISLFALDAKLKSTDSTLRAALTEIRASDVPVKTAGDDAIDIDGAAVPMAEFPVKSAANPELEMFNLINAEREKYGLNKLVWDEEVAAVARAHSRDMAKRNFFGHTNPDGHNSGDRLRASKVPFYYVGETLARGYSSAAEVLEAWMKSTGHRNTILNTQATRMGVGYYDTRYTVDFIA